MTFNKCKFQAKLCPGLRTYSNTCCMLAGSEEERVTRRVSYLKATWPDRMNVDSDPDVSDSEPPVRSVANLILLYCSRRWCYGSQSGELLFFLKITFGLTCSANDAEAKTMSLTWVGFLATQKCLGSYEGTANKLVEWILRASSPL